MQLFRFLSNLDLFGIPIDLIYKQKSKHTTRLGGIISVIITFLITLQIYSVLDEVFYKRKPSVIFEEKIVLSPSRNDLTLDNFIFAFGILDASSIPFIDESIYKIQGEFRVRKKENSTSLKYHPITTNTIPLIINPCKQENFQSKQTMDYFLSLNYTNLYCISLTTNNSQQEDSLFLQGQYDNDIFSFIRLVINRCDTTKSSQNCKDNTTIENKLLKSTLQVYYTNQIIEVTNYDNPFKSIGQTQFWNTNIDFFQRIILNYRTVHLIDDVGILFSNESEKKTLQFSYDRSFMNKKSAQTDLFDITINLEKNKESSYIRYYLKLDKAASLIGGMFNILLVLGALISKPYSKIKLYHNLINSTFDFAQGSPQSQTQIKKKIQGQESNQAKQLITSPKIMLLSNSRNESLQQLGKASIGNDTEFINQLDQLQNKAYEKPRKSIFKINQINTENIDDISQNPVNQKIQSNLSSEEINKKLSKENIQKNRLNKKNMNQLPTRETTQSRQKQPEIIEELATDEKKKIKISLMDYFRSIISKYLTYFRSEKSLMVQYSKEKLAMFTDIRYVINKLIELDKLKMLLLDENQLQIFNYIEKPLVDNKCINLIRERQNSGLKEDENVNDLYRKNQYQNQLVVEEAFKKIMDRQLENNRQQMSTIDKKLVKLVDNQFVTKYLNSSNSYVGHQKNNSAIFREYSVSKKFEFSQTVNENNNVNKQNNSLESPQSQKQIPFPENDQNESFNKKVYLFLPNQNPFTQLNHKHSYRKGNFDSFESLSNIQINAILNKEYAAYDKYNTKYLNKQSNQIPNIECEQERKPNLSNSQSLNGNNTPFF